MGEGAISYLDRLLRAEVEYSAKQAAEMHSRLVGPANRYFEDLRKSTAAIGATLSEYDRFRIGGSPSPYQPAMDTISNDLVAQAVQRGRERAEELKLVRLTAEMTAQSARALKELTESASVMLADREERNREEDRTTRTQLNWAIFSVIVSAVLAAVALWISAASFRQDKANNEANDKWQESLLKEVREENVRRAALDQENQRLKAQLEELSATVGRMMESKLRMADSVNPSSPRTTTTRVAVPR